MAMTPEAKVKKQVKAILDALEVYHFSPMQNGMGRAGIPDIIACHSGRFIGIECKAGRQQTHSTTGARTQPHTKRRW